MVISLKNYKKTEFSKLLKNMKLFKAKINIIVRVKENILAKNCFGYFVE
jgi:hypothetical protein